MQQYTNVQAAAAKYQQYRAQRPAGAVVVVTISRWQGWAAAKP